MLPVENPLRLEERRAADPGKQKCPHPHVHLQEKGQHVSDASHLKLTRWSPQT